MAWEVMHTAKVLHDSATDALAIQCGCGGEIIQVGNAWRDVTGDFTWHESIVPLYYAVMAGNRVLQLIAEIQLIDVVTGEVHLFDTDKWRSMTDSKFPIMNVHQDGTVTMIQGSHWPDGYVTADLTSVALTDTLYINIFVPVEQEVR